MIPERQVTSDVLMVRPACFGFNPETATTNAFQRPATPGDPVIVRRALAEFDGLVGALDAAGVRVLCVPDTHEPHKPDAVYPNNWVTFHADGTVVLYPLLAASRHAEVRTDVLARVERAFGVRVARVLDLRAEAAPGQFLEGTGSLVLDRPARVAYACRSERTHPALLARFAEALGYATLVFDAEDGRGVPVYHTNVLLWIGTDVAGVCLEALPHAAERHRLRERLEAGGHEVLELDRTQMERFAGNALALESRSGEPLLVLSHQALSALAAHQRARLERSATLVVAPLDTIERHGGGSARCMLAEVFLPPAGDA